MLRILVALSAAVTLMFTLFGRDLPRVMPRPSNTVEVAPAPRPLVAPQPIGEVQAPLLAGDDFSTTADGTWPSALKGGSYALFGPASDFSVAGGSGIIRTPAGQERSAVLIGVRARDVDARVRVQTDRRPEGGDQFIYLVIRRIDEGSYYRARVRVDTDQRVWLQFARTLPVASDLLGDEVRLTESADVLNRGMWIRAAAFGQQPTTLRLKAWAQGVGEPADWQYTVTDTDPRLESAGAVGVDTYVSARASNGPVSFKFSDFSIAQATADVLTTAPVPVRRVETPAPAPSPAAVATPAARSAAEVWQALAPQLDRAWGSDTPATVALLEPYVTQFPDEATGREKLYAALIAMAADTSAQGDLTQAAMLLEQARTLEPARGEATVQLLKLTPTPRAEDEQLAQAQVAEDTVAPTPSPVPQPAQVPQSSAVQRAPAVTRPANPPPAAVTRPANQPAAGVTRAVNPPAPAPAPVVRPPAPTPTKIPFVPPHSGP